MLISSLPSLLLLILSTLSVSVHSQCLNDQKALLLELKSSELNFNSSYSKSLVHWNQSDDCCSWNGVECGASGHVTGLYLQDESISGEIKNSSSLFNLRYLEVLDLHSNALSGKIPHSFSQLQSLRELYLSNNLFNGTFQLENIQSLSNLTALDLSRNNLSVEVTNANSSWYQFPKLETLGLASCNLSVFPDLIKQSPSLRSLDLSDNRIVGSIPSWIWEFEQLSYVDYSNNNFSSTIPTTNFSSSMHFFSLANNSLIGEVPASLCSAAQLQVLDLSLNHLRGNIPPCLLENMENLEVLNLKGNNIQGSVPHQFPSVLRTLDLSHNYLSGKIPESIANCKNLAVLNVGYNNFDDHFPCMLPSTLRVLVLRFNRFHGELRCHKSWPNLQIVDISFNNFSGSLHPLNFSSWTGMIFESDPHLRPKHSGNNFLSPNGYYQDEVTLTMKGIDLKLVKIWPDFTSIDFSSNKFQGDIPDAISKLTSLYLLNLSHNGLTGKIPRALGALTELESLDISANHLKDRIPEEIVQLTFLSFLNVSYNELVGKIPMGFQFQTFSADSFRGNKELCGFPLNRNCSEDGAILPKGIDIEPPKSKDEEIEWEYVFAALGYVVGLGSSLWTLLCWGRFRERYFEKIDEVVDMIFYQKCQTKELGEEDMKEEKEWK